jgi:N-carbamoyl-L-amino-acid hydrolase
MTSIVAHSLADIATRAQPPIDAERLWGRVEALAAMTLGDVSRTRRAFFDMIAQVRVWLRQQMEAAGLAVTLDTAGNLVGRREGRQPKLAPIVTGSYCDTVVVVGRFDGAHVLHEAVSTLSTTLAAARH